MNPLGYLRTPYVRTTGAIGYHCPAEPTGTYEGDGYVILRHASTEVVEKALRRLVTLVRAELG